MNPSLLMRFTTSVGTFSVFHACWVTSVEAVNGWSSVTFPECVYYSSSFSNRRNADFSVYTCIYPVYRGQAFVFACACIDVFTMCRCKCICLCACACPSTGSVIHRYEERRKSLVLNVLLWNIYVELMCMISLQFFFYYVFMIKIGLICTFRLFFVSLSQKVLVITINDYVWFKLISF